MRGQRGDRQRPLDILEAVNAARTHIASRAQLDDATAIVAATHWLEIVGEAVNGLSPELRDAHPGVAWQDAVRMRNRLIHGYFDTDVDLLWDTIERDLPTLETQVRAVLDALPG